MKVLAWRYILNFFNGVHVQHSALICFLIDKSAMNLCLGIVDHRVNEQITVVGENYSEQMIADFGL